MSKLLPRRLRPAAIWPLCLTLIFVANGCSIRRLAINSLANTLASGGDVFASDNDPELVREALPFALKTQEMLLAEAPDHVGLLLSACQNFTQYSYAFVEIDLPRLELDDYRAYKERRQRARNLYLRARDYCLEALDLTVAGTSDRLRRSPEGALEGFEEEHVPLLYWSGAAWGAAIGTGLDQPALVADAPAVRELLVRALALEPDYGQGILQEAMMALESLPEAMGGSLERARQHYERALALHGGKRPSTWVSWAERVAVPQQDRAEFERLMNRALEVDPELDPSVRLVTLITQKRARMLLDMADDLFL